MGVIRFLLKCILWYPILAILWVIREVSIKIIVFVIILLIISFFLSRPDIISKGLSLIN